MLKQWNQVFVQCTGEHEPRLLESGVESTIKVFHVCMTEISRHVSAEGVRRRSLS